MPIRETPHTGVDYPQAIAALWAKAFHLRNVVDSLYSFFNSTNITDLNSYRVRQIKRISTMVDTYVSIAVRRKDLVSANILQRSLADSLVAFFLIYDNDNPDLIQLRHYLYILDGNNKRNETVGELDLESYPEAIREQVSTLYAQSKKNFEETKTLCVDIIKHLEFYKTESSNIDKLIKNRNWKFQEISKPETRVSWETLYDKSNKLAPPDYTSYLSEDVHGLSFSVENLEATPKAFTGSIMYVCYVCQKLLDYMDRRMTMLWLPQVQEYYDKLTVLEKSPKGIDD